MLVNKNIFCNTPWYEIHVYWDGSYGICCQESHKLYPSSTDIYNVKNMSIMEWFNSKPAADFRLKLLEDKPASECRQCYIDESHNGVSRRIRSNQKSVIFMKNAFEPSFAQSPGFKDFKYSADNNGKTKTHPIDLHIDLGNYCNLACKMCNSRASSTIASQNVKWGIASDKIYLGQDWTKDQTVWDNFKTQLLDIPQLNNIHFMGGETLLTDRFEDLVDTMIEHKRFDLCFSFVSNGTVFKPALIEKLKKFKRVGIEVSLETVDERNSYIRQGTNTNIVLTNLSRYLEQCNNSSVTLSIRPAPSLLSVGSYIGLLKYALEHNLIVKSNFCYRPEFLNIIMLPKSVKALYADKYKSFISSLGTPSNSDYNASDPHNYIEVITDQAVMCLSALETPTPSNAEKYHKMLVEHCKKWDAVYNFDARKLYPEFSEIWDKYGY